MGTTIGNPEWEPGTGTPNGSPECKPLPGAPHPPARRGSGALADKERLLSGGVRAWPLQKAANDTSSSVLEGQVSSRCRRRLSVLQVLPLGSEGSVTSPNPTDSTFLLKVCHSGANSF